MANIVDRVKDWYNQRGAEKPVVLKHSSNAHVAIDNVKNYVDNMGDSGREYYGSKNYDAMKTNLSVKVATAWKDPQSNAFLRALDQTPKTLTTSLKNEDYVGLSKTLNDVYAGKSDVARIGQSQRDAARSRTPAASPSPSSENAQRQIQSQSTRGASHE